MAVHCVLLLKRSEQKEHLGVFITKPWKSSQQWVGLLCLSLKSLLYLSPHQHTDKQLLIISLTGM